MDVEIGGGDAPKKCEQERFDIDKPLWDQSTFYGRFRHFLWVTDSRTCFVADHVLDDAKKLLDQYRNHQEPPNTTRDQIIYAKKLYESAFHPDTGEKGFVLGRMSCQVPGNMVLTGLMLNFYKASKQLPSMTAKNRIREIKKRFDNTLRASKSSTLQFCETMKPVQSSIKWRPFVVPSTRRYDILEINNKPIIIAHCLQTSNTRNTKLSRHLVQDDMTSHHNNHCQSSSILGYLIKTIPQALLLQWINQTFNAVVNYTNRNAKSNVTTKQIGMAYVMATGAAVATVFGTKSLFAKSVNPILQRYVPFFAVAAANCINVPLMRQNELINGIELKDEFGRSVNMTSTVAAVKGISQVVISRISMAAPVMLSLPVVMERLQGTPLFIKSNSLPLIFQILYCGAALVITTPGGCALFPQTASIDLSTIQRFESDKFTRLVKQFDDETRPCRLYFNKGL